MRAPSDHVHASRRADERMWAALYAGAHGAVSLSLSLTRARVYYDDAQRERALAAAALLAWLLASDAPRLPVTARQANDALRFVLQAGQKARAAWAG